LRTHTQTILPFIAVLAAAAILTLMLSCGVNARTTFQSSPILPTQIIPSPTVPAAPTWTLEPTKPAGPTIAAPQLTVTAEPLATPEPFPTPEPPAAAPTEVLPTPTVSGFLPAPTIVNPNDVGSLPLAQPMITNPGSAPEPAPTVIANDEPGLQAGLALLNLLWLACGAAILIGGAMITLLLLRRSGRL
jgi:hypothetical protein